METPRRELSEDVSFRVGTLLVVEQSGLENRRGGVIYTVVYGTRYRTISPQEKKKCKKALL